MLAGLFGVRISNPHPIFFLFIQIIDQLLYSCFCGEYKIQFQEKSLAFSEAKSLISLVGYKGTGLILRVSSPSGSKFDRRPVFALC